MSQYKPVPVRMAEDTLDLTSVYSRRSAPWPIHSADTGWRR